MSLKEYSRDYLNLMQHVFDNNHILNVSTITYICDLNVNEIDLKTFIETFETKQQNTKYSKINMKPIPVHKKFEISKRGKIKKTFFNQITLNFEDINKKSIKIFSNGKLQLTGLTSLFECKNVSSFILDLLKFILPENDNINIDNGYIAMINSNFSVAFNIDLYNFNKILQKQKNCFSVYNPESYPAINFKIHINTERCLSVFIFGTGNIVITGSKTLSEMTIAYKYVTDLLKHNDVSKSTEYVPKKVRDEPYLNGYNIRQYMSCLV